MDTEQRAASINTATQSRSCSDWMMLRHAQIMVWICSETYVSRPRQRKYHFISIFGYSGIIRLTQLSNSDGFPPVDIPLGRTTLRFHICTENVLPQLIFYPEWLKVKCQINRSEAQQLQKQAEAFLFDKKPLLEMKRCHHLSWTEGGSYEFSVFNI